MIALTCCGSPTPPRRLVSLAPNATEILLALGLGERLVGVDESSELPADILCERVGGFKTTDIGKVIALSPDLVIAAPLHVGRVVPRLDTAGLPVFLLMPRTIPGLLRTVFHLGTLAGVSAAATRLIRPLEARVGHLSDTLLPVRVRPVVYLELSPQRHTAGPGTVLDDLIVRAGGLNLGMAARVEWPSLSVEFILRHAPDVVILATCPGSATAEAVRQRPGWGRLAAVKENRIYGFEDSWVKRSGLGLVPGLEAVARCLHPDRF